MHTRYTLTVTDSMISGAQAMARTAMKATSYDQFRQSLISLNQIVRGYNADNASNFRDKDEAVFQSNGVLWVAPGSEKIEPLLQKAWKKSFDFSAENRAEYLIYAINAIHPFKNGNGRTGRSLYCYDRQTTEDFKSSVWSEQLFPMFAASHNELVEAHLERDLIDATSRSDIKTLILKDAEFDDPYYFRENKWSKELSEECRRWLLEKNGNCFKPRHELPSLRFPHVVLLDQAIKEGHTQKESLPVDSQGILRLNIDPQKISDLSSKGANFLQLLKDRKNQLVENIISDQRHIIADMIGRTSGLGRRVMAGEKRASPGGSIQK